MQKLVYVAVSCALFACKTQDVEPPDTTPMNTTAVIISESSFNGLLLPNTKGKTTQYVRGDRRRSANDFRFENWFLRNTAGRFFNGTDEILRLDRQLQWQLDSKEKTYTECPLLGCIQPGSGQTSPGSTQPTQPNEPQENQCKLTVTKNTVKGSNQSDKRQIAGAEAGLFKLAWTVELKDSAGKKAQNTVMMDFWTTTPSGNMKSALDMEQQFTKNYVKAISNSTTLQQLIASREVIAALSTLGNHFGPKLENWAVTVGKELQKMKGYPLAIKVEWTAKDETCGAGMQQPATTASMSKNPLDWVLGKGVQEKTVDPNTPIVQYSYEVKTLDVRGERDSVFDVPRHYKLVK